MPHRWTRTLAIGAAFGMFLVSGAPAPATTPPEEHRWERLWADLDDVVHDAARAGITLSVAAADLSGRYCHATLVAGGDERVKGASVIKLALLATLMDKIDRGELERGTPVHIPAGSSNIVGGAGTLQNRDFPLDITLDELMRLMVQISDNSATNVLIDVVGGFDVVNGFMAANGYKSLWLGRKMIFPAVPPLQENYITANEITRLLTEIWNGTLVSRRSSDHFMDLMRGQQVNTKFGAVIPRKYLANKTGELDDVSHDAGIITLPGRELALTTTTSYTGLPQPQVNEYVQETARIAYRFTRAPVHGDQKERLAASQCQEPNDTAA
jgi:beta-lactamase class A